MQRSNKIAVRECGEVKVVFEFGLSGEVILSPYG